MNALVKEIEGLKSRITSIELQDHVSPKEYDSIHSDEKRIEELRDKLKGYKGVAVKFVFRENNYSKRPFYLTDSPVTCFCDNPTVFEDVAEAKEYLDKAHIGNKDMYDIEFVEVTY